jgi:hypothetical protein
VEISTEQLAAEAGHMALEIRFKDRAIDQLQAENARLRAELADTYSRACGQQEAP